DTYELVYRIPDVADGSVINVQATAVTASGTTAMLTSNVIVVKNGVAIAADRTIAANDLSLDNQSLVISGGTTTIAGAHTFRSIALLRRTLVHSQITGTSAGPH